MVIKILTELKRRIKEHNENFNNESENIRKNQSELKNIITNEKYTIGNQQQSR